MIEDKSFSELQDAWRRLRAFVDGLAESYVGGPGQPPPDAKRIQKVMAKLELEEE